MQTGELRKTLEFRDPFVAQFSLDGRLLAVTGGDSLVRIYGTDDFVERRTPRRDAGHSDVGLFFTPDGARLVSASTGEVRVWDISPVGPSVLGNFRVSGGSIDRLVVAADESAAYATVYTKAGDLSSVHRVDIRTGEDDEVLSDIRYYFSTRPLVSPDLSVVATIDDDWDYVSELIHFPGGESERLGRCDTVRAFDRDGRVAAFDCVSAVRRSGDSESVGASRIVDLATGDTLLDLGTTPIYTAAFGPPGDDGRRVSRSSRNAERRR